MNIRPKEMVANNTKTAHKSREVDFVLTELANPKNLFGKIKMSNKAEILTFFAFRLLQKFGINEY